jgi:hypothetical protein
VNMRPPSLPVFTLTPDGQILQKLKGRFYLATFVRYVMPHWFQSTERFTTQGFDPFQRTTSNTLNPAA